MTSQKLSDLPSLSSGSFRTMSLALTSAVARARGPVAACVTRCVNRASPNSVGRSAAPPLALVAACTPRGSAVGTPASTSATSPRCVAHRVLHQTGAHRAPRTARFSAVVNANATESDTTAADDCVEKIEKVQQRLGVTLSDAPTVGSVPPVVVVMSGPSGVGKDAVLRRLLELKPSLSMLVTATDRAPRAGEVDGVDYHFVTTQTFQKMIANDELIEHAVVYGQYKGIPKSSVRDKLSENADVVLRLDVQGAAAVKTMMPNCVSVFVAAESELALAKRLAKRGTETLDELTKRVETARAEMARVHEFDYVVVNGEGKLEEAAARLGAIIDAEKCRRGRQVDRV